MIRGNIRNHKVSQEEINRLYYYLLNRKGGPAGRGWWFSGSPGHERLGGRALGNCWFVSAHDWTNFVLGQDLLMLGGGVGISVEHRFVSKLPKVKKGVVITHKATKDADFIVPDSREGWCELFYRVLESFFVRGKSFSYSTVCVRGGGEAIKGFGGTASGPLPLINFIEKATAVLVSREGKAMRPIDAADLFCSVGEMVVAGNVRRCLPGSALVHTKNGLMPISKVEVGADAMTSKGYRKIINKFVQGTQKLVRIHTEDGHFDCTPNHRMAVLSNVNEYHWVEAQNLKEDDRLISSRTSIEGGVTSLPSWSYDKPAHSTTCVDITVPKLDADMAWFIGLFQADGYTYANREKGGFNAYVSLVFAENEYAIAERAKVQLERFGVSVRLVHRKDENSWMVHAQSKQVAWYLDEHVKKPRIPMTIPSFIMEGTRDVRLAFLAGLLDGDGSANNRPVLLVSTVYESFAKQVQVLAYSCGFETRLRESSEDWASRKGWQKQYFVSLVSNHAKLEMSECPQLEKELRINKTSQRENGFPSSWFEKNRTKLNATVNNNVCITRFEMVMGNKDLIGCPVRVKNVESLLEEADTYDIEVEDAHEFFCDGYLTHNSAIIVLGDPWDRDYLKAKRWDLGGIPTQRAMANWSVVCDDVEDLHPMFWKTYEQGEPFGIFNRTATQMYGRIGELKKDTAIGTNPCAETGLEDSEICNLQNIAMQNLESKEEFMEISRLMHRWGKRVTCEDFEVPKVNEVIRRNRRIGTSLTGCLASDLFTPSVLNEAYAVIQKENEDYSKELNIPLSIRTTTLNPGGTVSKMFDCRGYEGIHAAYSRYIIQRVRFASNDPLLPMLRDAGHYMEPVQRFDGTFDHNTQVVDFYEAAPNGHPVADEDWSTWKQLEATAIAQKHWADQSVSVTVYYKREEIPKLKEWLTDNISQLKTISFLCHSEHGFKQAPKEAITKEQYERLSSKLKPIDVDQVDAGEGELSDMMGCAGGACPVK
jgi:intein/homing endonuclease